jgi:hypothetical protein
MKTFNSSLAALVNCHWQMYSVSTKTHLAVPVQAAPIPHWQMPSTVHSLAMSAVHATDGVPQTQLSATVDTPETLHVELAAQSTWPTHANSVFDSLQPSVPVLQGIGETGSMSQASPRSVNGSSVTPLQSLSRPSQSSIVGGLGGSGSLTHSTPQAVGGAGVRPLQT